jgi:holo-[acyl-carrier protein] synthase
LVPEGHVARIDLTITDDYPLAQAVVIISAVPAGRIITETMEAPVEAEQS